ncbi:MAG: Uma2 family endonuclease [Candidatus Hodarchaeales archaeon]
MELISNKKKLNVRPFSGKIYFTYSDLSDFPEFPEGPLIEILQGDLFMVPSPSVRHQALSRKISLILGNFLKLNPLGEFFYAPIDVVFSQEEVTIPDLIYISKQKSHIIKEKNIQGTPDLIIEILSSNCVQSLERKRIIYEKYSVPEYWVIDPLEKVILSFQLKNNNYSDPVIYQENDTIESKAIPGLSFSLDELFQ